MSAAQPLDRPITRADIEAKFREFEGEVDERKEQALTIAVAVGAALVVGVALAGYVLGRRRGRKRTTVVEIRRV